MHISFPLHQIRTFLFYVYIHTYLKEDIQTLSNQPSYKIPLKPINHSLLKIDEVSRPNGFVSLTFDIA